MYDFKYDLKGSVLKLSNDHLYESIDSINNSNLSGTISFNNAVNTGIVTYYFDGYEEVKPENVTMEMFDESKYSKTQLLDNALIAAEDNVYKISKNENWSLMLPIEEAMAEDFLKEEYIKEVLKDAGNGKGKK